MDTHVSGKWHRWRIPGCHPPTSAVNQGSPTAALIPYIRCSLRLQPTTNALIVKVFICIPLEVSARMFWSVHRRRHLRAKCGSTVG